jgi:uncharacterized protein YndB with AHSA1/START domain
MTNAGASRGKLQVSTPSERVIVMTRMFNAPRRLVFDALTKPELVKQWLLGPPGWSMPVCEIDLHVGGAYRFVWRKNTGGKEANMGISGVFREILAPERFVATEKFDDPWYPGEAITTNQLVEEHGKTTLMLTILYESREIRDAVLKTPMEEGVGVSYDRLAALVEKA